MTYRAFRAYRAPSVPCRRSEYVFAFCGPSKLDSLEAISDDDLQHLQEFLEREVGPNRFPAELIRAYLSAYGFAQTPLESLAETLARALGIGMSELKVRLQQGLRWTPLFGQNFNGP